MDMKKGIQMELNGQKPNAIKELNLDDCRATNFDGLTDEFSNLERLSCVNLGLESLEGFPKLNKLKTLDLSENNISSGLEHLAGCSNITHLVLNANKIKDIDALKPLVNLIDLQSLSLFNCDVTTMEDYRERVFEMFPKLKYLDCCDKDGLEEEDDESEEESDEDTDGEVGPGLSYLEKDLDNDEDDDDYKHDSKAGEEVSSDEDDEDDEEIEGELSALEKTNNQSQNNEADDSSANGTRSHKRKLSEDE